MSANYAVNDDVIAALRAQFCEDNDEANRTQPCVCAAYELASAAAPSLLDSLHAFVMFYEY